ncbi:uncharacterized protein LOC135487485 [Lineus longissimus]|uniref:uncharacterized protein LOC135487485 n=1 Tax=Lineus longissimus TaxID=88925 RepID=UPI002B4C7A4E
MLLWIGFMFITAAQAYQVLHVRSAKGSQSFTWAEANAECQKRGMNLASRSQLQTAFQEGLDVCRCGWIRKKIALKPIQYPRAGCGNKRKIEVCNQAAGAVAAIFGNSNAAHDAFCYSPKGESPEMSTEICDTDRDTTLKCRKNNSLLLILEVKRYMTQTCRGEISNITDHFPAVAGQCSLKQHCKVSLANLRLQDTDVNNLCTCASIRYRCIVDIPVFDICPATKTELTAPEGYLTGPKYPNPMPNILNIMQCNCTIKSSGKLTFLIQDIKLHRNVNIKECQQNLGIMGPSENTPLNSNTLSCADNGYEERTIFTTVSDWTSLLFWNRPENYDDTGGDYGDYEPEDISGGRFLMKYDSKLVKGSDFKLVCERTWDVAPPIINSQTLPPSTALTTLVAVPPSPPGQINQGVIIGAAVGGGLLIIIIVILVIFIIRGKRRTKKGFQKPPIGGQTSEGQIANPSYNAAIRNDTIGNQNNLEAQAVSGYNYIDESDLDRDNVEFYSTPDLANGVVEESIYVNDEISRMDCVRGSYEALNPKYIERQDSNIYEGFDEPKKKGVSSKASGKSNTSGHSYAKYERAPPDGIEEENVYDDCVPQAQQEEDMYASVDD